MREETLWFKMSMKERDVIYKAILAARANKKENENIDVEGDRYRKPHTASNDTTSIVQTNITANTSEEDNCKPQVMVSSSEDTTPDGYYDYVEGTSLNCPNTVSDIINSFNDPFDLVFGELTEEDMLLSEPNKSEREDWSQRSAYLQTSRNRCPQDCEPQTSKTR